MLKFFLLFLFIYYAIQIIILWVPLIAAITTRNSIKISKDPTGAGPPLFLTVIIPCRDGCEYIPEILKCLENQSYPKAFFKVLVLADNCSDETAAVARKMGVDVYERSNSEIKTKGAALNELLSVQLKEESFDGLTILDVDSSVGPEFLARVAGTLKDGAMVTQAMFVSKNPNQTGLTAVGDGAQSLIRMNQMGRMALGLSAHLLGSGITLSRKALEQLDWHLGTGRHLTEDLELGIRCTLNNIPIRFAPDEQVTIDLPEKSRNVLVQRRRWSAGPIELMMAYAWPISRKIILGDWRLLEATLSLLLSPPYSVFWFLWGIFTLFLFLHNGWPISFGWVASVAMLLWMSHGLYYLVGLKAGGTDLKSLNVKNVFAFISLRMMGIFNGIRLVLTRRGADRWVPTSSKPSKEKNRHEG